jgi:hypothetical protein
VYSGCPQSSLAIEVSVVKVAQVPDAETQFHTTGCIPIHCSRLAGGSRGGGAAGHLPGKLLSLTTTFSANASSSGLSCLQIVQPMTRAHHICEVVACVLPKAG